MKVRKINPVIDGQLDLFANLAPVREAVIIPFPEKKITAAIKSASKAEVVRNKRNFRITNELEVLGNMDQKFIQNLEAIKLLQALESEGREATAAEKSLLVKYTGWGGIPHVFDMTDTAKYAAERDMLRAVLPDDEWESARASVNNAHYTSPEVVGFVWNVVKQLGFTGGKIIEPSVGNGHFVGLMPSDIAGKSNIHAVEIDSISARITNTLYPDVAMQHKGLEKTKFQRGSFDLAISNIPFGNYRVADPEYDKMKLSIHDYFFAKSLGLVREGGLVAFITSSFTMDKSSSRVREYLNGQADLVAAFRLPNGAFSKMANTDVMTDVIILKKRKLNEVSINNAWLESKEVPHNLKDIQCFSRIWVNEYFVNNPDRVIGVFTAKYGRYGNDAETKCLFEGDLPEALTNALQSIPSGVYQAHHDKAEVSGEEEDGIPAPDFVKEGAYAVIGGRLMVNEFGTLRMVEGDLNSTAIARIKGMVELRDRVRDVLRIDIAGADGTAARAALNVSYDMFTKKHGFLWSRANRLAFRNDPDYPLVLSLEFYDEERETATKAEIFRASTVTRSEINEQAENLTEAIAVSLNKNARLDVGYIAGLLGSEVSAIEAEFVEQDIAFQDPDQNFDWVMKDEYLSGNVRIKLATAEVEVVRSSAFVRNVSALKSVMPDEIAPEEIDVKIGTTWIPPEDISAFVDFMINLENSATIAYSATIATWGVKFHWQAERSVENNQTYGTERITAEGLLDDLLNLRTPTVYDIIEVDGKEKRVVNVVDTEAARDKAHQMQEKFKAWIWSDENRRDRLALYYNEKFNSVVERMYDGSHLVLPGMNQAITLRAAQKNVIWRTIVSERNTLYAHAVGAGKTLSMIASGVEGKRLGICRKPVYCVPNHMLEQFAAEFMRAYPAANILAASKDDLASDRRKLLLNRIATGSWDGVIITHSSFEKLQVSEAVIKDFMDSEIDKITIAILEEQASSDNSNTKLVKQLESAKKRVTAKLEVMANRGAKDEGLLFDELGIDMLFVDEADIFKNLWFNTKMTRVSGLPQTASMRAFDMYLKTRLVSMARGDRKGVVFATATPIANCVAEMYTMQRYLQPMDMEEYGIAEFDAWAANFGETVHAVEISPDGSGYRMHTRFCKYVNVPELMSIFRLVADIQTKQMLKLPVPELEGGRHIVVKSPATEALKAYVATLVERAEKIRNGGVDPKMDNMLVVTNDGRKAALDMRLVDPSVGDHDDYKVNAVVKNVYKEWLDGQDGRLTQLVFCDLSTPNDKAFSVYNEIRAKLVARGVPESEIAFVHDYDSDAQKATLFKRVRAGIIRVLLGSTQKCGFGTNIQDLLVAEHHVDAPWRPRDVEQRDGRIERQGNKNKVIRIYRYVTEGSFDAYSWQTLETKARFIAQVMTGASSVRRMEDVELAALSYAEVKAIASGNPMVIEKAGVDADVAKLSMLETAYHRKLQSIRSDIRSNAGARIDNDRLILNLGKDIELRSLSSKSEFSITIHGKVFTDKVKAGAELIKIKKEADKIRGSFNYEIGDYRGFKISLESHWAGSSGYHLNGSCKHSCRDLATESGAVQVFDNQIRNLDERLKGAKENSEFMAEKHVKLEKELTVPFEYSDKLHELLARQREIDICLGIVADDAASELEAV